MTDHHAIDTNAEVSQDAYLAINVGNTHTKLGYFCGSALVSSWLLSTEDSITSDEAVAKICEFIQTRKLDAMSIEGAIVASVVPTLTDSWVSAAREFSPGRPYIVGPGLKSGMQLRFINPSEVGADRLADAVAAKELLGAPCVAIDLGTTTNFNIVDSEGAFAGGVIAPGLKLSLKAASRYAAKLSLVDIRAPKHVIGKSTQEAMQSGAIWGEIARIDGILSMIFSEMGDTCPVVISGEDAQTLSQLSQTPMQAEDNLTLLGLGYLYRKNRN